MDKQFLSVKDIQNYIGCGRNKAYSIINSNGFPKIRIGKQFYVPESDFEKWVNRNIGKKVLL